MLKFQLLSVDLRVPVVIVAIILDVSKKYRFFRPTRDHILKSTFDVLERKTLRRRLGYDVMVIIMLSSFYLSEDDKCLARYGYGRVNKDLGA